MPTRPNIVNARPQLQRESEIFIAGYPMPVLTEYAGDVQVTDDTYDVFGLEEQLTFRTIEGGTLRITAGHTDESQTFLDVLSNQKPDPTAFHTYFPDTNAYIDVVRMYRRLDDDGYKSVEFFGRWNPLLRVPSGGPRERGTMAVEGRCEVPIMVYPQPGNYCAVMFDVVELSAEDGTKAVALVQNGSALIAKIPPAANYPNSNKLAFSLEVQVRDGSGNVTKYAHVPVTATNVIYVNGTSAAGGTKIVLSAADLQGTGLVAYGASANKITHAFVTYYLESASATGLMGQPDTALETYAGRFDAA